MQNYSVSGLHLVKITIWATGPSTDQCLLDSHTLSTKKNGY